MEELKKELQEKGYTFFKMQDYSEFADEYEYYKKYICNAENNLLNYINSARLDGNNPDIAGKGISLNSDYKNFEEAEIEINKIFKSNPKTIFHQYYYKGSNMDVLEDFKKLVNKIIEKLYNEPAHNLEHTQSLTYYKPDCFLKEHRDGKTGTRVCAVLIYLNDIDYNPEWGGNIVFEGTETVPPIYGNIAILDFKEGNCLHEVKKVVDGYGRYAFLDFVSTEKTTNTENHY
jgi:hypothetical protein